MTGFVNDLRFALRLMLRRPGYVLVVVAILALGVAVNTVTFSMVNTILLRPLPFHQPDRLVWMSTSIPRQGQASLTVSYPNFADWRRSSQSFQEMAALRDRFLYVRSGGDVAERIRGAMVTPSLFRTLGVRPDLGRVFTSLSGSGAESAVISHGFWQRRFGGRAQVLGQVLSIDDKSYTITGVMPSGFHFPEFADLWIPLEPVLDPDRRAQGYLNVVGRLKEDVSLAQAQSEMGRIAQRLEEEHPEANRGKRVSLLGLQDYYAGRTDRVAVMMLVMTLLVLVVACANLANLLLTRAFKRRGEMAVRSALGADRLTLARQLVVESLMMALAAAPLGVLLARLGLDLLVSSIPFRLPFWVNTSMDFRVLAFVLGLTVLIGFVFGLVPLWRLRKARISEDLRAGRGDLETAQSRSMSALVVGEIALAMALLAVAGLMVRGYQGLAASEVGFQPEGVLAARLRVLDGQRGDAQSLLRLQERLMRELRSRAAVAGAATASTIPSTGGNERRVEAEEADQQEPLLALHEVIDSSYFEVLQASVIKGRSFTGRDAAESLPVAVVNRTLAQRLWPGREALGRQLKLSSQQQWMRVVGVIEDIRHKNLEDDPLPAVYTPFHQSPGRSYAVLIRGASDSVQGLDEVLRSAAGQVSQDLTIIAPVALKAAVDNSLWLPRLGSWLLSLFAALALILAGLGLYAIVSASVNRRTQEIGVRMAMGALPGDVLRTLMRHTLWTVAVGLTLGLAMALGLGHLLASAFVETSSSDWMLFLLLALGFLLVASAAVFLPARRAMNVEPLQALRTE